MSTNRISYANATITIPYVWHYVAGTFSLICLLFGLFFNGLVLVVFLRNKLLRVPRNYFLLNLAATDVGLLLTNSSMHAISSFFKRWIFGQIGCNFYSLCGGIFGLTSIGTMAAISLTRLAAVRNPFSSLKLTSRFTIGCLALTWLYGSFWIIPPIFGWNRFVLEGFDTSCTFDYASQNLRDRTFIWFLITGGFLVPLTIIIVSYVIILSKLSKRGQNLMKQSNDKLGHYAFQGSQTNVSFSQLHQMNLTHSNQTRSEPFNTINEEETQVARTVRRTEARATRTSILICAIFCLAWGPYALMALLIQFGFQGLNNVYLTATLGVFTKVAACLNPLIYALTLSTFREQLCSYMNVTCSCPRARDTARSSTNVFNRKSTSVITDRFLNLN